MKKHRVALALALVLAVGPLTSGCSVNAAQLGQIGQLLSAVGGMLTKTAAAQPAATNTAAANTGQQAQQQQQQQLLQQGMSLLGQQPQAQQQLAQFQQAPAAAPTVQGQ